MISFYFISFVIGACIGSFLHAASFRLENKQDPIKGRSSCPKCRKQLRWFELIPLISYFSLRGKCRSCGWGIPFRYVLLEISAGILFVMAFYFWKQSGATLPFLFRDLVVVSLMVFLFLHDYLYYLLPDIVTIPAIILLFISQLLLGVSWQSLVLAILIGAGFFAFQFFLSKGKWIGGGDIRLGALMGIILGWPSILLGLMIAYISGACISIALVMSKKKQFGSMIPFGTFLTASTLITLWWGQPILQWYLRLL